LAEGGAAVDDGVDADDADGAHHGLADSGQAQPAPGLAEGMVGGDEDVDAAGVHERDLAHVDDDAGTRSVGRVQGLAECVAGVVVDLSGQGQHADAVGGGGHDRQLTGLPSVFAARHFSLRHAGDPGIRPPLAPSAARHGRGQQMCGRLNSKGMV
jgi:hypothetical protein